MRVAYISDPGNADGTIGGAELTMAEFAAAAPESVEVVPLSEAETVIVGNCVTYPPDLDLAGRRVIRYHNDLARHEHPALRAWLEANAEHVFTSPFHRNHYGLDGVCIPPALDLDAYRRAASDERAHACALGAWANPGKGQILLAEWAADNGPVDVYGAGGPFAPVGGNLRHRGAVRPEDVANVLGHYETFVHLPTSPEPFGRSVVEAWAAGCDLVINDLIGARHYIEQAPERLETAGDDFWELVCRP